jgi:hypothetical protein
MNSWLHTQKYYLFIATITTVAFYPSPLLYLGQAPIECRNFSASQLRLCLSDFSPATYTNVWEHLNLELQDQIKVGVFDAIYEEQDLSMKKHIADTIGEIAGTLIAKNDNAWPTFKGNV